MGVDLRVLPQYAKEADFSHCLIELARCEQLFDLISKLENEKGIEVPEKGIYSFSGKDESFEETCYGRTIKTPYGDVMKGVLVRDLKKALIDFKTPYWRNRAFISFLREMPNDLIIWLFWH